MMSQIIEVAEIGTTGIAASIAAFHLGLYRIDLLMAVFFMVALAGQMITAMLARRAAVARSAPRE